MSVIKSATFQSKACFNSIAPGFRSRRCLHTTRQTSKTPALETRSGPFQFRAFSRATKLTRRQEYKNMAYQSLSADTDMVFFRPAAMEDLDRIAELEALGYPADEAASKEKMEYRLANAADLFMVAVKASSDQIIGFTCATATDKEQLEEDTMSIHVPEGTTVCIHSVCVAEEEQRKGVATRMLTAYLQWVPQSFPSTTNLQLICKEAKKGLYERVGFKLVGPSKVVHGSDPWLDMKITLP